jgi:hypothetical protein
MSILRPVEPFGHPFPRSTSASQRRDFDSPSGLRPLAHPWAKAYP